MHKIYDCEPCKSLQDIVLFNHVLFVSSVKQNKISYYSCLIGEPCKTIQDIVLFMSYLWAA